MGSMLRMCVRQRLVVTVVALCAVMSPEAARAMGPGSVKVSLNGTPILEGTYLFGLEHWSALQHEETTGQSLRPIGDFRVQPLPDRPRQAVIRGNILIRFDRTGDEAAVSELWLVYRDTRDPRPSPYAEPGWRFDPDWIEDTVFGTRTWILIAASIAGATLALVAVLCARRA